MILIRMGIRVVVVVVVVVVPPADAGNTIRRGHWPLDVWMHRHGGVTHLKPFIIRGRHNRIFRLHVLQLWQIPAKLAWNFDRWMIGKL